MYLQELKRNVNKVIRNYKFQIGGNSKVKIQKVAPLCEQLTMNLMLSKTKQKRLQKLCLLVRKLFVSILIAHLDPWRLLQYVWWSFEHSIMFFGDPVNVLYFIIWCNILMLAANFVCVIGTSDTSPHHLTTKQTVASSCFINCPNKTKQKSLIASCLLKLRLRLQPDNNTFRSGSRPNFKQCLIPTPL